MRLNLKETVKAKLAKKGKRPGKKDEIYEEVKTRYVEGMEARRPYEARWVLNLAFLAGKQYSFFNQNAHTLNELKRVKGRVRNVDNQLLPRWRRQVADLLKTSPQMSVVPSSNDPEDIEAAKVGDKVLKAFYRNNHLRKKLRLLGGWIYGCGNGFLDDQWNPSLGPTMINPKTGKLEYLGDADVGVWSPFEVIFPAMGFGDTEMNTLPWIIKSKFRDLGYIANNYKRGDLVVAEEPGEMVVKVGALMGTRSSTNRLPGAFLNELYLQPCKEYPKGMFLVGANGIVLERADYPYKEYNLEHFKDIEVPGQFYGMATLEEGIGKQRVWNKTYSSLDEFNRTMGKGKWLAPKKCGLTRDPDDTHGEVLYYNPVLGHKPEVVSLKNVPGSYETVLNITKVGFEDLFSQHEVSRGTNKSDIRSGEMVAILREQDAHGNIPTHLIFEEGFEGVMGRILKRIQAGYQDNRMLQMVGREGEFEIFSFKGADLRNNTDVHVKRQSFESDSRIAREATILKKFELGLYGDPADPEVRRHVMNMLDDAVVKDIYSDTRADEKYARFENKTMMQGRAVRVNDYDDHILHLKELNHHRKQMDFQKIKVTNPQMFIKLDTLFTKHALQHQQFVDRMEKKMMQRAMMMGQGQKPQSKSGGPRKAG